MEKKWNVKRDCRGLTDGEIISVILADRGIENETEFFNPNENALIPYEELKNIDAAAKVINDTINSGGTFMVHFDTDCDGISAGTIAYRWLKNHTDNVRYMINEGKNHGLMNADMSQLQGVDVLWIVDSIETRMFTYQNVLNSGVKHIIISDHHLVNREITQGLKYEGRIILVSSAVDYPNPALSGSATTWKLCSYCDWLNLDDYAEDLVDLAATGTIADMVDIGMDSLENRYICHKGLNNQVNPALKKINGSYEFNSQAVGFGIAPLINSANRMNENENAVKLFISDDKREITDLVRDLKFCKEDQNDMIAEIMPELEKQGEEQIGKKVMFFFMDGSKELSGLLGNKLLEKYQVPIIVLSHRFKIDEETGEILGHEYTGSCRAAGIESFKEYIDDTNLVHTGGHENACGIWFDAEVLDDFKVAIEEALKDVEFVKETTVDIQLDVSQITTSLIKKIKGLNKISGQGFKPISVMVSGLKEYVVGSMSGGKHLKIMADDGDLLFIKWNFNEDSSQFNGDISAIGSLDCGFFGRTFYRQFIMDDWRIEDAI